MSFSIFNNTKFQNLNFKLIALNLTQLSLNNTSVYF